MASLLSSPKQGSVFTLVLTQHSDHRDTDLRSHQIRGRWAGCALLCIPVWYKLLAGTSSLLLDTCYTFIAYVLALASSLSIGRIPVEDICLLVIVSFIELIVDNADYNVLHLELCIM